MSGIKHAYVTPKPDGADSTKVSATKWNASHTIDPGTFLQGSPDYGLGVDGALALDGSTTVLGMVPISGVYTMTRDIHASSVTFTGGAKLFLANWRLFCTGTITGQGSGTTRIHNDGNAAVANVAGAITAAGFYSANLAGGAGASGTSVGTTAIANSNAPPIYSTASVAGGAGGTSPTDGAAGANYGQGGGGGGATTGAAGETGGGTSLTALAASNGYGPHELETGKNVLGSGGYQHGSGGGGGGAITSSGTQNAISGGGGASGGKAWVAAQKLVGLTVSARGGNGANGVRPTGGGAGNGAAAGGGGGAGGEAIVKFSTCSDLTCDVSGGTGGTGDAVGASHVGKNGGAGFKGRVFAYNLAGDGTAPTVVP